MYFYRTPVCKNIFYKIFTGTIPDRLLQQFLSVKNINSNNNLKLNI